MKYDTKCAAISHWCNYSLRVLNSELPQFHTDASKFQGGEIVYVLFLLQYLLVIFYKYIFLQWLWLSNEDFPFCCGYCY